MHSPHKIFADSLRVLGVGRLWRSYALACRRKSEHQQMEPICSRGSTRPIGSSVRLLSSAWSGQRRCGGTRSGGDIVSFRGSGLARVCVSVHGGVHEDREDSIGVFGLAWLWPYVANAMDGDGYGEHEWMDDIDG